MPIVGGVPGPQMRPVTAIVANNHILKMPSKYLCNAQTHGLLSTLVGEALVKVAAISANTECWSKL